MKSRATCLPSLFTIAALAAALVAGTSIQTAAATSTRILAPALSPLAVLRGSAAPLLPRGSVRLGAFHSGEPLSVDVTLRVPHPAALQQYIADLSDRSSPLFHHFLQRGEFGPMFGPSLSEIHTVESVLEREGLRVSSVASDRLSLTVNSTVGAVEKAFHVGISRYRLPSNGFAFANASPPEIPASISSSVQAVIGLNSLEAVHSLIDRAPKHPVGLPAALPSRMRTQKSTAGPSACPDAASAATNNGTFTADQLASYYGMTSLYGLGDLGQGVHVALAEFEPNSAGDIATYKSCYQLSTSVVYTPIDKMTADTTDSGSGEAALDIEDVLGLAPNATIDVYQGLNGSDKDTLDVYGAIVNDDADQVVSTSWGLCELDSTPALIGSEATLFQQAATQGQTVFAAAGDAGSTDCYGSQGTTPGATLSVDDPASQPYVVGVGGTSIGTSSETVWNESSNVLGAGGGGVSTSWCMPSYQDQPAIPGLINPYSQTNSANCGTSAPYLRQAPDVSADADPDTGYTIYYAGGWGPIGGTSAAAPLWAAVAALIDASPFCAAYGSNLGGGDAGVRPEGLYKVVSTDESYIYSQTPEALSDVTSGDNDYVPSGFSQGWYPATTGYDMASGLGTPLVSGVTASGTASNFYPGLAALMCRDYATELTSSTITKVSPSAGPTTTSTTVTITGTGFLPIAGADMLLVGPETVVPSCSSTSSCTAVLPPSSAGTVNLRMVVEDYLAESPTTSSDLFAFAPPPTATPSPTRSPQPTVEVSVPPEDYQLSKKVVVSFSATDASSVIESYDVRYHVAPWNSRYFGKWVYPASWQGTMNTSEALDGRGGNDYCFNIRARTSSKLTSAWSRDYCVTLPVGSTSLGAATRGWTRHHGANYYLGSYVETTTKGAELLLQNAQANRLALVVTKCRNCGSVAVYVNGTLLTTVSTYNRTIKHGAIIFLPPFSWRKATIVLKAVTKSKWLIVEGLGVA
jgi:hypothetical protein